jgi:hypothetical protein
MPYWKTKQRPNSIGMRARKATHPFPEAPVALLKEIGAMAPDNPDWVY